MTAGNNGTQPPEGDDPFGYLYRGEGGQQAPAQQQGVPRTSYQHVRAVGERRYSGQQAPAPAQQAAPPSGYGYPQTPPGQPSGYGYPQGPPPGQPPGYGYPQTPPPGYAPTPGAPHPNAHYAAPETHPGGLRTGAAPGGHGRTDSGGGARRNGLLLGALAVVGAVVIGVGAAVAFSGDDADPGGPAAVAGEQQGGSDSGSGKQQDSQEQQPGEEKASEEEKNTDLPSEDASSLRLDNGPVVAGDVSGSQARDGNYVTGMNQPGASVTWSTEVPKSGKYRLYYGYTVPGKDMELSLQVNDGAQPRNVNFKNFAHGPENDWEKSWTYTYAEVQVDQGQNTFRLSCGQGDQCDVAIDRVWLAPDGG
ncbi:hypothetical protein JJV70_10955 [Streptomyces sp. JJ66]|uniref:hypothetical protein n=1 Tax=Streptomyces sp. JJ66 TaxID=2803843 RepID=UPI001C57746D|nr:hypothetical protein [Streptomyces sp. JJ66]MBW1602615.1 hypothetical protein [Streptomyces sp. JJ66]